MPLSVSEQYQVAMSAIARGDIDLMEKLLTNPAAITLEESKTVAERLGFHGGFLSAAINTAADPLVWLSAWMSRKFPTNAWLRGTIPQRFVGTANEFSGISLLARPSESAFRGTNIPRLNALAQHRQAEVMKVGKELLSVMDRPRWKEEMPIVSMLLEGGSPAGATPELQQVANRVRGHMDDIWNRFLMQTKRIEGGLDKGEYARVTDFPAKTAPKYLRNYLPHIPLQGTESTITLSGKEALSRLGGKEGRNVRHLLETKGMSLGDVWTPDAQDNLVSTFQRFQDFANKAGAQVYNPHLFRRVRHNIKLATPRGQELLYTDLNLVMEKYVASAARTYSLNAPLTPHERGLASVVDEFGNVKYPTADPIIAQVINQGLDTVGAQESRIPIPRMRPTDPQRYARRLVPGTGKVPQMRMLDSLVKAMRGNMSEDQALIAPLFNNIHNKLNEMRDMGKINNSQANEMAGAVSTIQRQRSYRRKMDAITEYLYATTLGMNPMSAMRNMLQPLITTAPAIGIGPTVQGIKEFAPRFKSMVSGIANEMRALPASHKGMSRVVDAANRSFEKHFPELVAHRLDIDPRLYDISEEAIKRHISADGKFIDKNSFFKFLLTPFTTSEFSNRAITFFGSRHAIKQAMRTGEYPLPRKPGGGELSPLEFDELLNFEAANIVNATQFRPGPGSRSVVQSVLPSPLRQFTTFPLRLLNFFADSTVRGALTQSQLQEMTGMAGLLGRTFGGRNLGTIARTVLYGKIATNGIRDVLGVDIADSIGLGAAFPTVPEDAPFAPLPIPPLPGAIMSTVSAFANRDLKELHPMVLPGNITLPVPKTLFPGGIGISRLFRVMNQWQPDMGGFVDRDERLMFKSDAPDAILQMLGVPLDKMRRERQALARLHSNRQVVREFGKKYRLAMSNHDFAEMENLRRKYKEAFPDMPPLTVSSRELARFNESRRITRVQRMLNTLPAAFQTMESDVYDYDPDLISQPAMSLPWS